MAKNSELAKFRDLIKKSQEDMANILDISVSFYTKVEHGLRNPSYNFIKKFKEQFPDADINKIFFSHKQHEKCNYH